jgi:hypothetical protein
MVQLVLAKETNLEQGPGLMIAEWRINSLIQGLREGNIDAI